MRKLLAFIAMMFISLPGYLKAAPTPPTTSPVGGTETWYYIEFSQRDWPVGSGNRYLFDQGADKPVIAVPAETNADGILWKIEETETDGEYRIVSKLGNGIEFAAAAINGTDIGGDRYYASATSTAHYNLDVVNTDYYRLFRVGGNGIDKSNNSNEFDAYGSGDGVSITFKAQSEITPSTAPTLKWLGASSTSIGTVTIGMASETKYIYLLGYNLTGNVTYSQSNAADFEVLPASPAVPVGGLVCLPLKIAAKPTAAGAISSTLTIDSLGLSNIVVTLTATGENTELPVTLSPTIEPSAGDVWYYINYTTRSGLSLQDRGAGQDLVGGPPAEGEEGQLWKVVSSGITGKYKIVNKAGRSIGRTATNFISTTETSYNFRFDKRTDGKWQIFCHETNGHINKNNSNYVFTSYNYNPDSGSGVEFVEASTVTFNFPKLSTADDEHWYQIQFSRRANVDKVVQDADLGAEITQAVVVDGSTAQYWKFTGSVTDYQIESYAGHQIAKGGNFNYKAVAIGAGESHGAFGFSNAQQYWKLWNNKMDRTGTTGTSTRYLNDEGTGTKVNLYSGDDTGNSLIFIPQPAPPAEFDVVEDALPFAIVPINTTSDLNATVAARNLTGTITWQLGGTDADVFIVTPAEGWSDKRGGELTVSFTPTTVKTYSATLTIQGDEEQTSSVTLSGTGYADPLITAPATLDFGNVNFGKKAKPRQLQLTGTFLTTDNVVYVLAGDDASNFSVSPASPLTPVAGSLNQALTIGFTAGTKDAYAATLTVSGGGTATPVVINLTATGNTPNLPLDLEEYGYIQLVSSGASSASIRYDFLEDKGADAAVEIRPAKPGVAGAGVDAQLWKIADTDTTDQFQIVSKTGRILDYVGTNFVAAATSTATVGFVQDGDKWKIKYNGADNAFVSRVDNSAATYPAEDKLTATATAAHFKAYEADSIVFPQISTDANEYWYKINSQGITLKDGGTGTKDVQGSSVVGLSAESNTTLELWKLIPGAKEGGYKFVTYAGNHLFAGNNGGTTYLQQQTVAPEGHEYALEKLGTGWALRNLEKKAMESGAPYGYYVSVSISKGRSEQYNNDGSAEYTFTFTEPVSQGAFVIAATESKSAADYAPALYTDIVFQSTDAATGQLTGIPAEGLTVNGVVKLEKTFTYATDYPIGFPFDVATVSDATYGLKSYNGATNLFETATSIEAGEGYLINFPAVEGVTEVAVIFTSAPNPTLSNASTAAANGYNLVANPLVSNITAITDAEAYYVYSATEGKFVSATTIAVKPFEALVTVKGVTGTLYETIGNGLPDGINGVDSNDPVVSTKYYTLQGWEVQRPVENGVYIIKNTRASQKTEVVKVFFRK